MPVNKGRDFEVRDVYIDYPFEEVLFRWDHASKKVYACFYGEVEGVAPVSHESRLFNEALLGGFEISKDEYMQRTCLNV